ncbi:ActS/PrrB/RegB family redox-sensitive histidine kinase [Methyloceanibacter superfactus]|uniref:ActS/PrrB/RegB family redox-sensitive histidine kinase n=1 Tax=Methyloceanibacter superfactus TaxID=1774969 RepID=UPI0009F422F5|nr:ActS/PrrB/RegB family redox-sensitive histidine kinase [Methyloceanibacter superfactus]
MAALDNSQTDRRGAVPEWLRAGESRLRLQTIVRLRWLAVLGQSLTVIGAYWALGIDLPIGGCFAVIALSAWLNVALRIRYPASQRLKANYAFMMLGYDILQLAALLYLTGGLENPFAFLLVAPVTVSASTLPLRITVALGVLAIGAATVLTTFHHPLPWFGHEALVLPFPYVMGIWASVVAGILFIGFYSWRTAEEGRRMAEALAAAEMVLAREQKLSALDGLAAAAAHGLGTPLATIAVVTKELLRDAKEADPHYEDLLLVRAQAERCREILKELAGRGEELDIIVSRMPVSHLIEEVVAPNRLLAVPIEVTTGPLAGIDRCSAAGKEPVTQRNPGVIYGLGNLVENAIDFAASKVDVDAHWSQDEVRIVIADDGEGFPPHVLEQLGEPFVTTRPGESWGEERRTSHIGMGLGFFIAKTLLERSGAQLELANRPEPESGAVVTVIWPRARFEQPPGKDEFTPFI